MLDLSKESREQTQIIQDINTLNQKLNNKQNHFSHQYAHSRIQQKFSSFNKFNEIKESQRIFLNQLNNIEYFSQIGKKDNEEDSLFESGNHFLVANGHSIQKKASVSVGFGSNHYKNQENQVMPYANISQKNEAKNLKEDRILQILKEQDYIYRKEKSQSVSNISKNHPSLISKQSVQKRQYINTKSPKTKHIIDKQDDNIYLKRDGKNKINGTNSQYNLHNYLMIQNQAVANENSKLKNKTQSRLKTEESKPHFQTLEAYFEQVISNAVGNSGSYLNERQSKSKSIIKRRNNYPQKSKSEMECTFKPKILKKSQDMVKNNGNVVERLATQISVKKKIPYQPIKNNINKPSMQRIDQLSQPRTIKTQGPQQKEQIPSFRPSLSKKSLNHMSNCTYDVATRNKLWLQQKEQKLNRLRKEEEEQKQKREEGNYSPILQPYRGQQQAQFSKFGKQGMVQYFQRVSLAKKKNSIINIRREQGWNASKDDTEQFMRNNKQNMLNNLNRDKSSSQIKGKKQSYEDAVKQLHNKIMKLRI